MTSQADISVELSAYLDGQLSPDVSRWVDRAVTENPELARQLHDLRRIRTILRAIEPVSPGQGFVARVIAEAKRRGLMRRVVRQRVLDGVSRLAYAAAAVMLIAVVTGVVVLSFRRSPGGTDGTASSPPIVAAAPEPDKPPLAKPGGATGNAISSFKEDADAIEPVVVAPISEEAGGVRMPSVPIKGKVRYKKSSGKEGYAWHRGLDVGLGESRVLDLSVADLGAGAKEVEAVLASAGIVKAAGPPASPANGTRSLIRGAETTVVEGAATAPAKSARPKTESPSPRTERFYRIPGGTDELRFVVVAQADHIAAVTTRLGDLCLKQQRRESSLGLCAADMARDDTGLPRPATTLPKPSAIAGAKPKADSTTAPYHAADIERLRGDSQTNIRQRRPKDAPTSQSARQAAPGPKVLIITVRLRPPATDPPDPTRNLDR